MPFGGSDGNCAVALFYAIIERRNTYFVGDSARDPGFGPHVDLVAVVRNEAVERHLSVDEVVAFFQDDEVAAIQSEQIIEFFRPISDAPIDVRHGRRIRGAF